MLVPWHIKTFFKVLGLMTIHSRTLIKSPFLPCIQSTDPVKISPLLSGLLKSHQIILEFIFFGSDFPKRMFAVLKYFLFDSICRISMSFFWHGYQETMVPIQKSVFEMDTYTDLQLGSGLRQHEKINSLFFLPLSFFSAHILMFAKIKSCNTKGKLLHWTSSKVTVVQRGHALA